MNKIRVVLWIAIVVAGFVIMPVRNGFTSHAAQIAGTISTVPPENVFYIDDGPVTINENGQYYITSHDSRLALDHNISVASGITATITIEDINVNIKDNTSVDACALYIYDRATVNLNLVGDNYMYAAANGCICVCDNAQLNVSGGGSLELEGGVGIYTNNGSAVSINDGNILCGSTKIVGYGNTLVNWYVNPVLKIRGGTVTAREIDFQQGSIIIDGGTVLANIFDSAPCNSQGQPVYRVDILTLQSMAAPFIMTVNGENSFDVPARNTMAGGEVDEYLHIYVPANSNNTSTVFNVRGLGTGSCEYGYGTSCSVVAQYAQDGVDINTVVLKANQAPLSIDTLDTPFDVENFYSEIQGEPIKVFLLKATGGSIYSPVTFYAAADPISHAIICQNSNYDNEQGIATVCIYDNQTPGPIYVVATRAGNNEYNPVNATIELDWQYQNSNLPPIILGSVPSDIKYGDEPFVLTTQGGSSGIFVFTSNNPSVVSVDNSGKCTVGAPGDAIITVTEPGNVTYAGNENSVLIHVSKALQTSFKVTCPNADTSMTVGYWDQAFVLNVSGGEADVPVRYLSANPDVVSVACDGTCTIGATGTTTITVTKAGDDNYLDASASVTLTVQKSQQLPLSIAQIGNKTVNSTPFRVVAIGGSTSSAISYSSSNSSVVTVDQKSGLCTVQGAGTATITAVRYGDDGYYDVSAQTTITVYAG